MGALVSGLGIPANTTVVSYNVATSVLVVSQNVNTAQFVLLNFYLVANRALYNAAFNTTNPPLPKYYAGFNLKENKYVANLRNGSKPPSPKEINFGGQISGIKGFYATKHLISAQSNCDLSGYPFLDINLDLNLANSDYLLKSRKD